ncbi:MAG: hypothetical protein SVW57_06710 [Thermodesulfobacteriota bacterium]|nr:hypothetical protein [Thermodesulfobacteriota bacterium]
MLRFTGTCLTAWLVKRKRLNAWIRRQQSIFQRNSRVHMAIRQGRRTSGAWPWVGRVPTVQGLLLILKPG